MWRTEWRSISARIGALLDAGRFATATEYYRDSNAANLLHQEAVEIARRLHRFHTQYSAELPNLPSPVLETLSRFRDGEGLYRPNSGGIVQAATWALTHLALFRAEFEYLISDAESAVRSLAVRAFTHLQRSIVADDSIRDRWIKAFAKDEPTCEALGGTHLLLHGVWAFKTSATGERTDLVLQEPLRDLAEPVRAAEGLVLTEWKLVRTGTDSELCGKIQSARDQAKRYCAGILAGFEVASTRYVIIVSERTFKMPPPETENGVTFEHINIAVNPRPPSKT